MEKRMQIERSQIWGKVRIGRKDSEQESNAVWGNLARNVFGQSKACVKSIPDDITKGEKQNRKKGCRTGK